MRYYHFEVILRGKREKKHQALIVRIKTTSKVKAMQIAGDDHPTMVPVAARVAKGALSW